MLTLRVTIGLAVLLLMAGAGVAVLLELVVGGTVCVDTATGWQCH